MYLPEYHYCLPQDALHVNELNDLYRLYCLKRPETNVSPVKGSYASFLFLAITYEEHYLTYETLSTMFSGMINRSQFMNIINRLIQRGLMKSERFASHDNNSYTGYCLTAKGLSYIKSLLNDHAEHNEKIRRTGGKVAMHDYSAGINLLHLFCSPFRYEWIKEILVTNSGMKSRSSLCTDVCVSIQSVLMNVEQQEPLSSSDLSELISDSSTIGLPDEYAFRPYHKKMYIEEDLNTESVGTLLQKIYLYDSYSLLNYDNILIFSVRKPWQTFDGDEYSHLKIKALISRMKNAGCDSLYDYYVSLPAGPDRELSRRILIKTGVILPNPAGFGDDIRLGGKKKRDFSFDSLKRYYAELTEYRNLYHIKDFDAEQIRFTRHRKEAVVSVLENYMADPDKIKKRELLTLLIGQSVYFLPTNLIGNYYPFLFPDLYHLSDKMQQSLSCYHLSYDKAAEHLFIGDDELPIELPSVVAKNVFTHEDCSPGKAIVEDVGHDLSAMIRVLYLRKYYRPQEPFTVISIVDGVEDAIAFASRLNFYHTTSYLSLQESGYYYILSHDIGRENKIFSIGDTGEGAKAFYLSSDDGQPKETLADYLF